MYCSLIDINYIQTLLLNIENTDHVVIPNSES